MHDIISDLDDAVNHGHRQTDLIIVDFAKVFDKLPQGTSYYRIRGSTDSQVDQFVALSEQSTSSLRWPNLSSSPNLSSVS